MCCVFMLISTRAVKNSYRHAVFDVLSIDTNGLPILESSEPDIKIKISRYGNQQHHQSNRWLTTLAAYVHPTDNIEF